MTQWRAGFYLVLKQRNAANTTAQTWKTAEEQRTAERDQARTDLAAMTTARDNALSGLPAAINAVPIDQFLDLVLTPARAKFTCDSWFVSNDYWSVTFTRPTQFCVNS